MPCRCEDASRLGTAEHAGERSGGGPHRSGRHRGEGLTGMTRAWMYAGAPRVVASLWRVDDAATAALMRHFYQGLIRDRRPAAAALAEARKAVARMPGWRDPYYWAGFVLQGDWR